MESRDRIETIVAGRLRLAMAARKLSVGTLWAALREIDAYEPGLSEAARKRLRDGKWLSEAAIEKIRTGKTVRPRRATLELLGRALDVPVGYFGEAMNGHVFDDVEIDLALLERDYGPSVRSTLTFGPKRTLWLAYDTCKGDDYGEDAVYARVFDEEPNFPPEFLKYRANIERINRELEADPTRGRPFFDGPSFCLSGYHLFHSPDGHERKTLRVDFKPSRYANNVTAKSRNAANLRRKALRNFHFLDQPISWLSSGVGVAVVVFCSGGREFVVCRRSDMERFRSREFDVGVVEGINPVKDASCKTPDRINIHDVVRRGVEAELGLHPEEISVRVIGFGLDLEYYQWNFLCAAETELQFDEVKLAWQTAEEKFETMELRSIPTTPSDAAKFAAASPIWSSGLAALYTALVKRADDPKAIGAAFIAAFEEAAAFRPSRK